MMGLSDVWPLFGLVLRTPRLSLTPVRDEQLPELIDAVLAGIHDPAVMPFGVPWTDAPRDVLILETVKHHLGAAAALSEAAGWNVASLGVSRGLGYEPNGVSDVVTRPGEVTRQTRLRLDAGRFIRPEWKLGVDGLEPVLPLLRVQ